MVVVIVAVAPGMYASHTIRTIHLPIVAFLFARVVGESWHRRNACHTMKGFVTSGCLMAIPIIMGDLGQRFGT